MREIQYEIVKEIAVLSTGDSGYTKEINLISWNGKEPKYDIRSFSPNREKCGKGITLNADEAAALLKALQKELNSEYINCEPEVLLEMIADADWGTSNYSGPNKERYIHTYNMFDNNYFAMHIISACFATAGFAGVWKYNKIVYEPDYDFSQALIGTNKLRVYRVLVSSCGSTGRA